jgi:hypothetical protein
MPLRLEVWSYHANTWHDAHVSEWETVEEAKEEYIRLGYQARIIDKPTVFYDTEKRTRKHPKPASQS